MVEGYLIMINFIWQFIKIGIGVLLILGLSYILRILILIYKASKKAQKEQPSNLPLCDTYLFLILFDFSNTSAQLKLLAKNASKNWKFCPAGRNFGLQEQSRLIG